VHVVRLDNKVGLIFFYCWALLCSICTLLGSRKMCCDSYKSTVGVT